MERDIVRPSRPVRRKRMDRLAVGIPLMLAGFLLFAAWGYMKSECFRALWAVGSDEMPTSGDSVVKGRCWGCQGASAWVFGWPATTGNE
jgi:hypothetical protein